MTAWGTGAGARRGPLPALVEPQVATLVATPPRGDGWLHELKFDGYRIRCRIDRGRARLLSRSGKDWTDRYPTVAKAAAALPARQALLDGEVAVVLRDGTTSFNALQNAPEGRPAGELVYFVFDILHRDGDDLRGMGLEARKAVLADLLPPRGSGTLRYSDHVVGGGQAFLEAACRLGLEGMISKRRDGQYESGRGSGWLKIKCVKEQEFVIGGFTEPEGARVGLGALLLGVHDGQGALRYAGKVGTGFSARSARALRGQLDALERDTPPFAERPAAVGEAHWVRPSLVAEVAFSEWTPDGRLRHPSFKGLRQDKDPRDIVREEPRPAPDANPGGGPPPRPARRRRAPAAQGPSGRGRTRPAGRRSKRERPPQASGPPDRAASSRTTASGSAVAGVRITHPDRVIYPAQGIAKLELARFYEAIGDWILPHLRGRPTALVRCPEGVRRACFYQRHTGGWAPEALRRVRIQEKLKVGEYLVVEDLAGLIGLVQMGVLEIHTWNSRVERLEQPDRIVFDLDPGEGVPWTDVIEAARLVRRGVEGLGLTSFVKTTGGKGLHVVAPIAPGPGWDECASFAQAVAEGIAAREPERFVATMAKSRRRGKIFIDYLRNVRGATSVAAYSTRARPGAPVSTPLTWEELGPDVPSDHYTVASLPRRLRALAGDPWAGYEGVRQRLPATADGPGRPPKP